ncbi:MAG TPA: pyridoxal-phosphate dependent enzyme [Anaerolineales bacterium]|nr:pyridoxal-phosphate dependent enzyme [Anaerolineales bacterium]
MTPVLCTNCRQPYPPAGTPYRCPNCGGVFDFADLPDFHLEEVEDHLPGIWRYRHTFNLAADTPLISLGEGNTPLLWDRIGDLEVAFKLEYLNPTGSFKDRGSSLLASFLRSRGVEAAVEDSSGNAGASFAAYAARAGIKARIYIPDSASGPKRAQIHAYGAEVARIMGPRSNATEAVKRAAEAGMAYASHAYLPFNIPGYATAAYELVEQLGEVPGSVILPVGQGGLLLGLARGFQAMHRAGLVDKIPRLVGVQARACAPLWAVAAYGAVGLGFVGEAATLAEGIRVRHPVRGDILLSTLAAMNGTLVAVDEEDILPGRDQLARRGFYVEPTSAVVWPVLTRMSEELTRPIVSILTGSGFKYQG